MKVRLLIAVAFLVFAVTSSRASTITVTSTNDSGPGSLRAALASAADGDTIDASSITGTILLTSGELLVTNRVNVVGPGPGLLAVDGNAASRVFHIGSNTVVAISSLTIIDGYATGTNSEDNSGGGIYNDHATLTVSNCTVSGNSADNSGGGISNDSEFRFVQVQLPLPSEIGNRALSGNSAGEFGISVRGFTSLPATAYIINCTLSSNSAGSSGGGIYNDGYFFGNASMEIVNCTLSNNSAGSFGGGIANDGEIDGSASLQIVNTTLSSNSAVSVGGGIASSGIDGSATVTITNSTLNGNSAVAGGGVLNSGAIPISGSGFAGTTTVQIANSTVSGNLADYGGGIYNAAAALTLVNSTVSGNSATNGGGILNIVASVEIGSTILNVGGFGANITNYIFSGFPTGTVTSLGYNLSSDDGGGFLTATGDQINTDPRLGPLQNNGGPTFTHALLCGSPAIDQGKNFSGSAYDQRGPGFLRTVVNPGLLEPPGGDGTDIGAFEVQQEACNPAEQIGDLIALVQGLGLPSGTANSLIVKLQAAASALSRGNTQAACGSLGAFLNEVSAQNGKKLSAAQADMLIAGAARIRAVLGC